MVGDDALLEVLGRNVAVDAGGTGVPAAFIVDEEKRLVALDGSADRRAEEVDQQCRAGDAIAVIEEVVGGGFGAAAVLVERTMGAVGARAGDQGDVGARTAAGVSAAVGGGGAEFLHRVRGDAQDRGEGRAVVLLVDVGAIERDVRLVGASAVDGAVAVVGDAGGAVGDAEVGDAGLEA